MNKCPVCLVGLRTPLVMNPLSRNDNKTYICSACALDEAIVDFHRFLYPEWPKKKTDGVPLVSHRYHKEKKDAK